MPDAYHSVEGNGVVMWDLHPLKTLCPSVDVEVRARDSLAYSPHSRQGLESPKSGGSHRQWPDSCQILQRGVHELLVGSDPAFYVQGFDAHNWKKKLFV
ncbi:jg5924 [Pararge aegeria aegeria]|uniref:Jg5924 protein n=1 Tax=Pararge aegeria aegeria TaxID=348720 RepID=A0A8S4RF83_9NEOP|nr:jg5924 [Pararge aegeria aegeria]